MAGICLSTARIIIAIDKSTTTANLMTLLTLKKSKTNIKTNKAKNNNKIFIHLPPWCEKRVTLRDSHKQKSYEITINYTLINIKNQ